MNSNDINLTKIPKRVLNKVPKGIKPQCKLLKVGQALPVKTLGWAINLKAQLNESTNGSYEYWTEPDVSVKNYRSMNDFEKSQVKVFIGRIA